MVRKKTVVRSDWPGKSNAFTTGSADESRGSLRLQQPTTTAANDYIWNRPESSKRVVRQIHGWLDNWLRLLDASDSRSIRLDPRSRNSIT